MKRILVCGLWHETNTFSPLCTDSQAFSDYLRVEGDALLERHAGTNTEIGGFLGAAPRHDLVLVPALYAGAVPSGLITAAVFGELLDSIRRIASGNGPFDGALVALHGAMVAEGEPDADAAVLALVRQLVGPGSPIVATLDLHANVSPRLFEGAQALIGYDTYPHVDMRERGEEAVRVLARLLAGQRLARHHVKLPLLTVPQVQETDAAPVRDLMRALHEAESGALLTGSIAFGFPYADVPQLGVSVFGYGNDPARVRSAVDTLAGGILAVRERLQPRLALPATAIASSLFRSDGPSVLVEVADNVGGGSPGDGTALLEGLLDAGSPSAAIVLWDPAAARGAAALGEGAWFSGRVGNHAALPGTSPEPGAVHTPGAGPVSTRFGAPVLLEGRIAFAGPLVYTRSSSYMTGMPVDLGCVALVVCGETRVLLTERRAMPFDTDHLRAVGIDPVAQRILVVKAAVAWKAAFGDLAVAHHLVDTPGACAPNLAHLDYRHGAERLYPLNRSAI